ncbi:MAD2 mitotic arrest deficient-like protein [Pycnococcus provasolii]|uniref:MAD2 mitotic arrest deficient-like protein n=2 Tax=Pycnococcus provasolii TaxID=41880 RepID=A0A830HT58_9CHLO|nr:MAD2 mitotic arrest deficient-like protein [Pycnococcus provasolii]
MASSTSSRTKTGVISLVGSSAIVSEFFGYAVNSILFQRGIYEPETFDRKKKYGLAMMVTNEEKLRAYLNNVMEQVQNWLKTGQLQRLVLVVVSTETHATLERWTFDVSTNTELEGASADATVAAKPEKELSGEIAAILRQITASVSFLPLIDEPCAFDLLAYADSSVDVPMEWEESDARLIAKSAQVRLRSFNTNAHQVEATVAYRDDDADGA